MKTILIADDNPASRELLREALASSGARLVEAVDGRDALDKIQSESPDLALLDIQMPFLDGFAVLQATRSQNPYGGTLMIALTAFAMESDRQKIIEAGFNGYVSKPIKISDLRKQVHRLLFEGEDKAKSAEF